MSKYENMTAENKAIQLVDRYAFRLLDFGLNTPITAAKQCALIAVDEIQSMMYTSGKPESFTKKYWEEVKEEIKK